MRNVIEGEARSGARRAPACWVDARQPRFGQSITGGALLLGFVLDWPAVLPVIAVILGGSALFGRRGNLYGYLFRAARRLLPLGPARELEEAGPPRFANTLGFVFTGAASLAYYVGGSAVAGWALGLIVSGLALLAATTGLCVGCELYVILRRAVTRGRVAERLVVRAEVSEGAEA